MTGNDISSQQTTNSGREGVVIANYGSFLDIEGEEGKIYRCVARRALGAVVCGDRVLWRKSHQGNGVVMRLLPRCTLLSRPDPRGRIKPVAANIDYVVVVAAPLPGINEDLIDHYLVAAEHTGITPLLLINKMDLLAEQALLELKQRLSVYTEIGYRVIFASTKIRCGLNDLLSTIKGKNSIFSGESGVGKSSLINALLPGIDARVAELSQASGKGVHTTTTARFYHLPEGGGIIDSPGVREFGLGKMSMADIAQGFVEFSSFAEQCRFRNCTHRREPGCAVLAAVEQGKISRRRLVSYHRMVSELGQ